MDFRTSFTPRRRLFSARSLRSSSRSSVLTPAAWPLSISCWVTQRRTDSRDTPSDSVKGTLSGVLRTMLCHQLNGLAPKRGVNQSSLRCTAGPGEPFVWLAHPRASGVAFNLLPLRASKIGRPMPHDDSAAN